MKHILIVEDEADFRLILSHHFSINGWKVATAESGKVALLKMREFNPDVILSDISMPEKTGLELLAELDKANSEIPVILISGFADKDKVKEAWSFGAFDLIDKPFAITDLLQVTEKALEHGKDYVRSARNRRLKKQKCS